MSRISKGKILFRVDANKKIGWGHFYRCVALAEMLKGEFCISFAVSDPNDYLVRILESKSIKLVALPPQDYTAPDDRGKKELFFDLSGLLGDVDIVVLDGYWFGPVYQQQLRKHPVKVAIIEDEGKGKYLVDLIINHAPGVHKKDYRTDSKDSLFALGPNYAMLRASFLEAARADLKIPKGIKKVLISFGGLDPYNLTEKTLEWLLKNTDTKIHVVIGANYSFIEKLKESMEVAPNRVKLSQNLDEKQMVASMKSADAAILPASGVLMESIACRLPTISGTYVKNQERIFKGFLEDGLIINGGNFSNLESAWAELIRTDIKLLKKRHNAAIDGGSMERFCKLFKCLA